METKPSITRTPSSWIVLLVLLSTCGNEAPAPVSQQGALTPRLFKPAPTGEVATWQLLTPSTAPDGRFLQALTFDETRGLVVMFGGQTRWPVSNKVQTSQDMWEWSPSTGAWTLRPASGVVPSARGGAAMVYDAGRAKVLMFGGRAASGYNYEDLWEWDPQTGTWTERKQSGTHPSARAQHGMLYQKSTGKILLFGGGRSMNTTIDGTGVSVSLGDTWELDSATGAWTALAPTTSPSVRHDFGLVWDTTRDKAVLFGGLQIDIAGAAGVPKQDTWEWDPSTQAWSERAVPGNKPVQRFGHAMAYDGSRAKVVVFGGSDMQTAGVRNDMWDWDPATGTWTQTLTGAESGIPGIRSYSWLVYDGARARLEMLAGLVPFIDASSGWKGIGASNEIWELDPTTLGFSNRTISYQGPTARGYHAMAYNPATGKVYVFGGSIDKGADFADLWEWDGSKWTEVVTEDKPSGRKETAMAFDPVRQSLILFGGAVSGTGKALNDTWEWNGSTRKWTQLTALGSPPGRSGHGMVADTLRKKILLFGGSKQSDIWEWDGATLSWINRTTVSFGKAPAGHSYPAMSFDETRGKLVLYDGTRGPLGPVNGTSTYWEWDGTTAGWTPHDPTETIPYASHIYAIYDSTRRRHVFYPEVRVNGMSQIWELDANTDTWYTRTLDGPPGTRYRSGMVFDSTRRVAVTFGGIDLAASPTGPLNDIWEYTVKNLANGQGCSAASASTCASGNCVDGVCCASAGCTGPCMACNVRGSEGTCALAQAGTEVSGSCSNGQACDGTGTCKSKNGQACSAASTCASGYCIDGVCCNGACDGACKACNLAGNLGTCTPQVAGKDPDSECGQGTGACKSRCDGAGACGFPQGASCGNCLVCDGAGACTVTDPACSGTGGSTGPSSSSGTPVPGSGGVGGWVKSLGGVGGKPDTGAGGKGGNVTTSSVATGGSVGGTSSSSPGAGAIGGGVGGAISSIGGSPVSSSASQGGSGPSSSGSSNLAHDAGVGPDGGLVGRLSNRGCSCDIGRGESENAALIWTTLVGACLIACRPRRRR